MEATNFRPTKAVIDLGAIERNTRYLIGHYPSYTHYTAVVKADCYGYRGKQVVAAMLKGGANTLAASLLEEGLQLRQWFPEVPILLFTPLPKEQLAICAKEHLWATVANLSQAKQAAEVEGLKAVIRANGGCDIFGGPTTKQGFMELVNTLQQGKCDFHGLYLHSYNAEIEADTLQEYAIFEAMTRDLDLSRLPFVSVSNSLSLPRYEKKSYANGCRLGNIIYGIESEDKNLEPTFRLESQIIARFPLNKGQSVAYSHAYTAQKDGELLGAIPIGFGDGFSKTNIGRRVYIGSKAYFIVAVTMDMTHVLIDPDVNVGDTVLLIRDNRHLDEISAHIHGATEEPICALNKRVFREYVGE